MRLAAWRARGSSVRDSESIDVLVALVPSLSLVGLGMLFFAKAALGDRLDLSVFRLVTALLVLPAGATLLLALLWASRALGRVLRGVLAAGATLLLALVWARRTLAGVLRRVLAAGARMLVALVWARRALGRVLRGVLAAGATLLLALVWASRALGGVLRGRRLRAAALIALLAPASLVVVLPPRESAETAFDQDARARTAVASARPVWDFDVPITAGAKPYPSKPYLSVRAEEEDAALRRGYCLDGAFYDLVAGQPNRDPNYRGAVLASVDPSTGAVSCDFSPAKVDSEPKLSRDLAERLAGQREAIATSLEPRRGYCLDGVFYDLVAGQPNRDPNYRGAVLASVDPSTGAVSCDFAREGRH